MIRNIIFDLGRVLISFQSEDIMRRRRVPRRYREPIREALFHAEGWLLRDAGAVTEDDVIALACQKLPPAMHHCCAKLYRNFFGCLQADPRMYELVSRLKARGYGIYLCSNAHEKFRDFFPQIPVMALFDGAVISAEERCIKPGRRIYQTLFERFSLNPSECFFIDDMQANIDGALALGMEGYCYADADFDRLCAYLEGRGIL